MPHLPILGINHDPFRRRPAGIIEGHTRYVTDLGDGTVTVSPCQMGPSTTTIAVPGQPDLVLSATQGVSAIKNAAGGIDLLLSPGMRSKLEGLSRSIVPCPAIVRRANYIERQVGGGPSCGIANFLERAGQDPEIRKTFSEPITDQIWREDEGYESGSDVPGPSEGYEGQGYPEVGNSGPFHDDEGFFEGPPGPNGEETVEAILVGGVEEAAEIQAAVAAGDLTVLELLATAGTVTAGSILAVLYFHLQDNTSSRALAVVTIPKEKIHRVSKPKGDGDKLTTIQSSSATCPTATLPECNQGCKATSTAFESKETNLVGWACSEGDNKGCYCSPNQQIDEDPLDLDKRKFWLGLFNAAPEGKYAPPLSPVARDFFGPVVKAFCSEHFIRDKASGAGVIFDIFGKVIPNRRRDLLPPLWRHVQLHEPKNTKNANKLVSRAPPEKGPEAYKNFRFGLHWSPRPDKCFGVNEHDLCMSSFRQLQKTVCGTNSGGSTHNRLYKDASMNVGCGEIGWSITNEEDLDIPQQPEIGPQKCFKPYPHVDIVDKSVKDRSAHACAEWAKEFKDKWLTKDTPPLKRHSRSFVKTVENYEISWVPGCDAVQRQELEFPGAWGIERKDRGPSCAELLYKSYKDCNNGGGGGFRQVGCLKYQFHADSSRFTGDVI
ncbi:hypothetical protein V8F20_011131 [Naviculisporaceae sp. PSN 640]